MIDRFLKNPEQRSHQKADAAKSDNIPAHVAIIMDGNGRWAKERGMPRVAGHREGMKTINRIVEKAHLMGIKYITLYAFSTENWKRPKSEVEFLMRMPEKFITKELPALMKNNVKVQMMGSTDLLPAHTMKAVKKAIDDTADNTGIVMNIAMNYGGRDELVRAVKALGEEVENGSIRAEDIEEKDIHSKLFSSDLPDPDLLIRTSGEIRLSNFMLWQLAYSEFWFTDVLWPDFNGEHLEEAIKVFQERKRRYGGV